MGVTAGVAEDGLDRGFRHSKPRIPRRTLMVRRMTDDVQVLDVQGSEKDCEETGNQGDLRISSVF